MLALSNVHVAPCMRLGLPCNMGATAAAAVFERSHVDLSSIHPCLRPLETFSHTLPVIAVAGACRYSDIAPAVSYVNGP